MFFDFVDGGSWDEVTARANRDDFGALRFRQRVGRNIENRSTQALLVGQPCSMPVAIAPTGLAGLPWPDGEIAAALAAKVAGVPFTLSTMSMAFCGCTEVSAVDRRILVQDDPAQRAVRT